MQAIAARPQSIAVAYGAVVADAPPDSAGNEALARLVVASLERYRHSAFAVAVDRDMEAFIARLRARPCDLVFNLVDELEGDGRLIDRVPAALAEAGVAFTGSPPAAMTSTTSKLSTKAALRAAGLPTPDWSDAAMALPGGEIAAGDRAIVKSVWEHASIGLDDGAVVCDAADAHARLARMRETYGGEWFLERYVEGRELNVSVLEIGAHPVVLPIPEMVFVDYPPDKPRIVDYSAKWSDGSFESAHTVRRFGLESSDPRIAQQTEQLVRSCWALFGLRGYARIDLRVDGSGGLWIIDVNANPSLEADAGFAAATAEIGLSYDAMIQHIVAAAGSAGITHADV